MRKTEIKPFYHPQYHEIELTARLMISVNILLKTIKIIITLILITIRRKKLMLVQSWEKITKST